MKEALEQLIGHLEFWALVFGAIVVVGVAGETFFGIRIWWNNRKLQTIQHSESAALQLKISQANDSAQEAKREQEVLKRENLKLQSQVEQERTARLIIEKKMAWRRITLEQHDEFVSVLKAHRGSVVGLEQLGEQEARTFADDLIKVLSDSGWNVVKSFSGMVSPPPYGLICIVDDSTPAGKALGALLKTLPTANVRFAPVKGGVASILVGLKPPA